MRKTLILAALSAASLALPAQAAVTLSAVDGTVPYSGPTGGPLFFDFESATPRWNGAVVTGNAGGIQAQPLGSTGSYASAGPAAGTPRVFDLTGIGTVAAVSFIWGSVDTFNTLEVLGSGGVLAMFTGIDANNPANGNQTAPAQNPLVTLSFTGASRTDVTGLRFSSSQNAFEFDNLFVAVPEPSTWAMMIGGFGLLGAAARRARKVRAVYA
jgi:hypothetical protein